MLAAFAHGQPRPLPKRQVERLWRLSQTPPDGAAAGDKADAGDGADEWTAQEPVENYATLIRAATEHIIATSGNPPDLLWFIQDWVPEMDVTLLAGPGGGGKSYLMLMLQVAAVLGMPWLGLTVPTCTSLGLYSEDHLASVTKRLNAIAECYRTTPAELMARGLRVLPRPPDTELIRLDRHGNISTTPRWDDLRRTIDDLRPKLLIADNIADYWPIAPYDSTAIRQSRRVSFDPLCAEFGLTIIGLQNVTLTGLRATDEAKGSSGSLTWRDGFRSRLELRRDQPDEDGGESPFRTLSRLKVNDAPDEKSAIRIRFVDGIWTRDQPFGDTVDRIERTANERWLYEAVIRIVQSGRIYTLGNNKSNYLPRLLAEEPDRPKRFGVRGIIAVFEQLVRADRIKVRLGRDPVWRHRIPRVVAVDDHNLNDASS